MFDKLRPSLEKRLRARIRVLEADVERLNHELRETHAQLEETEVTNRVQQRHIEELAAAQRAATDRWHYAFPDRPHEAG